MVQCPIDLQRAVQSDEALWFWWRDGCPELTLDQFVECYRDALIEYLDRHGPVQPESPP